jgi:hypothetical protein
VFKLAALALPINAYHYNHNPPMQKHSQCIRVSSETRFAFCFVKLDAKQVLLFCETNWLFREISCFAKQPVLHVSLFLVRSSNLRGNPIFTSVNDNYDQCCGAVSFLCGSGPD